MPWSQAIHTRSSGPDDGLIHHSDRAIHYLAMNSPRRSQPRPLARERGQLLGQRLGRDVQRFLQGRGHLAPAFLAKRICGGNGDIGDLPALLRPPHYAARLEIDHEGLIGRTLKGADAGDLHYSGLIASSRVALGLAHFHIDLSNFRYRTSPSTYPNRMAQYRKSRTSMQNRGESSRGQASIAN